MKKCIAVQSHNKWEYFSKLHKKWVEAKTTDCKESLLKYGYKIRENSKKVKHNKLK